MKRESYSLSLLLAVTGLFSSLFLSAQQYRDAAAFGLKGNVKECKVISLKSGNSVEDPHLFSLVSFTREGRLSVWTSKSNDPKYDEFFDPVHSDGLLTSIKCKDVTKTVTEYRFRYHDGILKGFYTLEDGGYDYFFGELRFTTVNHYWTQGKSDYFIYQQFHYKTIEDELNSYIEKEFKKGEDVSFSLEGYEGGKVFRLSECTIREKDSHGNYVLFDMYNIGGSVTTIKRIITYWDDEPASDEPTPTPKPPVTETAPKNTPKAEPAQTPKTEEVPSKELPSGFRSATPKELSFSDILTRPFGVLPADRWRCPMDQILSELSRYGWKTKTDKKISSIQTIELNNLLDKSGYDLSVLGVIPFSVTAWFREGGKELSSMWYSISSKNHKEALRFCDRLISSLRSEGVNLPEPTKYATEVSAKYGKSIVRVKFPSKGSTVSFLQIDYWSSYWSSDGQWVTGWVE
jgi:hypothetical protein